MRSTTVFRIAQESLTNVARHAGARTASMRLFVEPRRLWLIVQDDGCGFVFDPGSMPMGVGLFGMKERAAGWRIVDDRERAGDGHAYRT